MCSRNASYSFRSLRTSRRSLMAIWTFSSSSSNMRLRDCLAFDLIIALKPFLSMRRSFFNAVVNEMRSFSNSWKLTNKVVKAVLLVWSVSMARPKLIRRKYR